MYRRALFIGLLLGHSLGLVAIPRLAMAVGDGPLISEVQMGGAGSGHAGEEFIELYNPTASEINLSGWLIQYRSSSAGTDCTKNWSTKATLSGTLPAHGYYLIAATGYLPASDARFSAGLSQGGGVVRLVSNADLQVDALAWGGATSCGNGSVATAPLDGQSLERRPGIDQPMAGNGINSDNNALDFIIRSTPEPQLSSSPVEVASDDIVPDPTVEISYLPLVVTEVLVDPASPKSDDHDEFIELANPNNEAVDTNGYALSSGNRLYHLGSQVLTPGEAMVVYSSDSHIALSNAGGSVQILDPLGQASDAAVTWPAAIPGSSWAVNDEGAWDWTTTPTPSEANVFTSSVKPDNESDNASAPTLLPGQTYASLIINELLPDPASPQTDANDEFIELYNPNTEAVNLMGYVIKTGSSLGNSGELDEMLIEAGGHLRLTPSDTDVPLANGGSHVLLFDPAGNPASNEIIYPSAKVGQAWARSVDGSFRWTTTPTPGAINLITAEVVAIKALATKPTKTTSAKKASVKASPKPKTSPKIKTTKTPAKAANSKSLVAASRTGGGRWLLFVLAGLTIAYIIYEFRDDLRNYFRRFRRHAVPSVPPRSLPQPARVRLAARPRVNW